MQGFLWYGCSKYPQELPAEATDKFHELVDMCRQSLEVQSGGFSLPGADTVTLYVAGNGWSIEFDHHEPRGV